MKLPRESLPSSELQPLKRASEEDCVFPGRVLRRRRWFQRSGRHGKVSRVSSTSDLSDHEPRVCANWRLVVGTFLINLVMPSIVSSFGVFMVHMPDQEPAYMYLVPVTNIICSTFFEPLCRHLLLVVRVNHLHLLVAGVVCMAFIVINTLTQSLGVMIASYGVATGVGSSVLATYSIAALDHRFPTNRGMAVALNHVASTVGYVIMPMVAHVLMESHDFGQSATYQAVITTPLLSLAIFTLPAWNPRHLGADIGSANSDIEMHDMLDRRNNYLMHNVGTTWRNPGEVPCSDHERCGSPMMRARKASFPVNIMPRIAEEIEGESKPYNLVEDETLVRTISAVEIQQAFNETPGRPLSAVPVTPTLASTIKRFITESLVASIKTPYFLPAVWIKFALRFSSMTFTALLPTLSKTITPGNTNENSVSGLTIAAFAALCTLTAIPFFKGMADKYQKGVLALGCTAEAIGFYVLTCAPTEDYVRVGCTLYGIGVSLTACSTTTAVRYSMGLRNQRRTAVLLDVLCTILIILASAIVLTVWMTTELMSNSFHVLAAIQVISVVMWLITPLARSSTQCQRMGVEEMLVLPL